MNLFRRALAPLLALLIATPVTAAPALWTFGDRDTTIYLFGTIHALPPGYRWQDARIRRAITASDTLVVETLIDKDPHAIARLFPPPDPSLPPIMLRVPERARAAFATQIKKGGVNQAQLDRMPTWQAAFTMMGATIKRLGIDRTAGVEGTIAPAFEAPAIAKPAGNKGAKAGKRARPRKIEGLETPSQQLALFANLSEADQRELLTSMVDDTSDSRTDYDRLLRYWATGNQPAIARAFKNDDDLTPHLREVLLRQRNAAWAQWLKARLAVPGTVFGAVGAGHLAGPLSVQTMLGAKGIRVQRIWNKRVNRRPARH